MRRLGRRQFVSLGLGATAALAGCTGRSGGDDAARTDWLPASEGGSVLAAVDFTLSPESAEINPVLPLVLPSDGGDGDLVPDLSGLDGVEDPLLRIPLRTGGRVLAVGALSLAVAGLGEFFDPRRPNEAITELIVADGVTIGRGDVDPNAVDRALREASGGPFEGLQFETTGEDGEYTRYGPVEGSDASVAVGDSTVLIADDSDAVTAALAARRGDRDRAVSADDAFGDLFADAGSGDLLVGWAGPVDFGRFSLGDEGPSPETPLVAAADDAVASLTFAPGESELTADLAVRDADGGAPADRLRTHLGTASPDSSVAVDGDRVSATATYTEGDVDLDFVERTETATPTTAPGGDDLPPAVAEAVPDDAFSFTYDAEEESVRVAFEEQFEADRVTARTVESGWETSIDSPGVATYLTVYVDPEGDEVVVTVTVDGATGTVARHEVP